MLIGEIEGCPVYVAQRQLDAWPHAEVLLDVEEGYAEVLLDVEEGYAEGFSLPAGDGRHFVSWASSTAIGEREPSADAEEGG